MAELDLLGTRSVEMLIHRTGPRTRVADATWDLDGAVRAGDGELGIEMIPAYSPEARGRSKRHFETIQGCLPNELALEGERDMAAPNDHLREPFWPFYNKRFAVPGRESSDALVPLDDADLDGILCLEGERVVGRDSCVSYGNRSLQIPPGPHGRHYVRRRVRVHEHADGRLSVFHGPRRLAHYHADGSPIVTT